MSPSLGKFSSRKMCWESLKAPTDLGENNVNDSNLFSIANSVHFHYHTIISLGVCDHTRDLASSHRWFLCWFACERMSNFEREKQYEVVGKASPKQEYYIIYFLKSLKMSKRSTRIINRDHRDIHRLSVSSSLASPTNLK